MSSPDVLPELLAIAIVVESSNTILEAWLHLVQSYVSCLVKRLTDSHPNHFKLCMAFIAYATADTVPSPLVCKKYFSDIKSVSHHMKESPFRLGLGRCNSGGSRGMAALEGFVAAIELFDVLSRACDAPARSDVFHLFHIAASPPDTTKHPQWNSTPHLDSITWDDLPLELTRRHISLSCIFLHSPISRFEELHAAISSSAGGRTAPWFTLRAGDSVLLSGFPNQAQGQAQGSGLKRSGESATPDAKRQRLAPPPTDSPTTIPSTTPAPPRESGSSPSGPLLLLLQLANSRGASPEVKSSLLGAIERLRHLEKSMQEARSAGNVEEAERAQREFQKLSNSLNHQGEELRRRLDAQSAGIRHNQPATTISAQEPPPSLTGGHAIASSTSGSQGEAKLPLQVQHPPFQAQSAKLSTSPSLATTAPVIAHVVDAQAQKMVEHGNTGIPPIAQPLLSGASSQASSVVSSQPPPTSTLTPTQPADHTSNGPKSTKVWSGSLTFRGVTPQGKREVQTEVIASGQNAADCRADTWPEVLALVPPREPVSISINEIQNWIQRHRPVLCAFHPNPHPKETDPESNGASYKQLSTLLWTRKLYALAAWTLPSGAQENNVLVFALPNGTLGGGFFPLTGIPEMPKSAVPTAIQQLSLLPPEQRNVVLNQIVRHRQAQVAMQSAGISNVVGMNSQVQQPGASVPHLPNTSVLNHNLLMASYHPSQPASLIGQQILNQHNRTGSNGGYNIQGSSLGPG
ncbi:hypothetical protein BDN72DRAFT_844507 [Pluteus cervinus]|uniref:Uncharacterized protein n=1 Tax=Pluteus cervinus TaxID=181527 RepID=A0ACD3AMZ7_9AGAR|nr:hypothetical protein BDN72DRAFT_844507 [Pluteus cervinus]